MDYLTNLATSIDAKRTEMEKILASSKESGNSDSSIGIGSGLATLPFSFIGGGFGAPPPASIPYTRNDPTVSLNVFQTTHQDDDARVLMIHSVLFLAFVLSIVGVAAWFTFRFFHRHINS
jgi:hypothetical protein